MDDRRGALSCQIKLAKIYEATEDWASACDELRAAESEAGLANNPRLYAAVQNNFVTCLARIGSYKEALERLPRAKKLLTEHGRDTDRLRLRWTEAPVLDGLGRIEEAETALRSLQQEFLDRRMPLDATLVSLDLAVVLFKLGNADALKTLAAELLPIFEARGLTTEAIVAPSSNSRGRWRDGRSPCNSRPSWRRESGRRDGELDPLERGVLRGARQADGRSEEGARPRGGTLAKAGGFR